MLTTSRSSLYQLQLRDAHAASENAAVADWKVPDTLEELIESCSEFLSGPPSDYIAWLETVEIKTITDLGIAMISDEAMLIAGNGDVGITELKKFAALVFAAVSKENPSTTGATADSTAESQEDKDMADKKARAKRKPVHPPFASLCHTYLLWTQRCVAKCFCTQLSQKGIRKKQRRKRKGGKVNTLATVT